MKSCVNFYKVTGTVVNMTDEMFNDGLFYRNKMQGIFVSKFEKWSYARMAVICFCCSVESWLNRTLVDCLQKKEVKTAFDEVLLKYLTDTEFDLKKSGFEKEIYRLNIPIKLKSLLPRELGITPNYEKIDVYLEISRLRNSIVHYTPKNFREVYTGDSLFKSVAEAPDLIEELIRSYYPKGGMPSWFSERKPKKIT